MRILDVEVSFDITSPTDVLRYNEAGKRMEAEAVNIPGLPEDMDAGDSEFLDAWMEMLNAELRLFGNFIDEVFGDDVAEKLLGNNPSLSRVMEINDALSRAMENQGREFGVQLKKYTPDKRRRGTNR